MNKKYNKISTEQNTNKAKNNNNINTTVHKIISVDITVTHIVVCFLFYTHRLCMHVCIYHHTLIAKQIYPRPFQPLLGIRPFFNTKRLLYAQLTWQPKTRRKENNDNTMTIAMLRCPVYRYWVLRGG